MLAKIQRNHIHLYKDRPVLDDQGNLTGQTQDILQLGIQFTEYVDLPTYGLRVDVTGITTRPELRAALRVEILELADRIQGQMQNDEVTREHFDDWGWADVEFETDNL